MKNTLHSPSRLSSKTNKKDPFQRLSLAVKKLDLLINRAHQLGSFTDQFLHEDKTAPRVPSSEADPSQPTSSRSSTEVKTQEEL